jgi:hypothetical protein
MTSEQFSKIEKELKIKFDDNIEIFHLGSRMRIHYHGLLVTQKGDAIQTDNKKVFYLKNISTVKR